MNNSKCYNGYNNTPLLWESQSIEDLSQFNVPIPKLNKTPSFERKEIRLGKLIEQYVIAELKNQESVEVIITNLQIIDNKITIGEIDCIIKYLEKIIHLEIVYKFYLYDDSLNGSEINKWIGPNRKDTFKLKLIKLRDKQFPIRKEKRTIEILSKFALNVDDIISKVYFKAQLFVPKHLLNKSFELINNDCVIGYYIGFSEYKMYMDSEFFMPVKLDWLILPHGEVAWVSHENFTPLLNQEISQSRSPLCWIKAPDGKLEKIFVVFWR